MYAHEHGTPGDAREFDDLYERYQPRLVRYCQQRLRSGGDAEDAAHEALLRALQAWSRFDRTLDAWPWLATIAGRVCADMRRRSARTTADSHDEPASDVHDLAVARLRASIMDDALDRLPARYRNPLVLKEFAGWTYRDIAQLEGTSVASVRSTIMRGRRYLGARVEEVARTQGQWPLPVIVPGLAQRARARSRRAHLARAWLERVAQTAAAAVDSSLFMGMLRSPAVHAMVSATAVAAATALSPAGGVSTPPTRSTTAPISVQASPVGAGAAISAAVIGADTQPLSDVKTVARVDPGLGSPRGGARVGETVVTVERQEQHVVIRVSNEVVTPVPGQSGDPYQTYRISCAKNEARRVACDAFGVVVDELAEE